MEDSERRQKLDDLELLERFDAMRSRLGHDYGSGQRGAELMRLRRRLEVDAPIHGESRRSVEIQEVAAAFERVGRPRLERARRDVERRGGSHTPTSRRTVETWERLETRLQIANRRNAPSIEETSAAARQDVSASIERRLESDDPILVREETAREAFVVYGLKDWPHAIACRSCAEHVFSIVYGAYGNPTDPGLDCELAYEGLCDQGPEAVR